RLGRELVDDRLDQLDVAPAVEGDRGEVVTARLVARVRGGVVVLTATGRDRQGPYRQQGDRPSASRQLHPCLLVRSSPPCPPWGDPRGPEPLRRHARSLLLGRPNSVEDGLLLGPVRITAQHTWG